MVISLDTTRRDHLSAYGYRRPTTPEIDALARDGLRFSRATAVSNWTLPTHASILSGLYPTSHRAHYVGRDAPYVEHVEPAARISPEAPSLAEMLQRGGYRTGAILANWWWLGRPYGLDRGFEHYDHAEGHRPTQYRRAAEISDAAIEWLEAADDRPFFLLLNYMDPHIPYLPPPPWDTRFAAKADSIAISPVLPFRVQARTVALRTPIEPRIKARFLELYDGEIAYMDAQIGRVIAWLRGAGLYDRTLVIVTGDHGEAFGEHYSAGHGIAVHEAELAVPMIVKLPASRRRGVLEHRVQHVDLMPTVLEVLGLGVPEGVQGRSMLQPSQRDLVAVQYVREKTAQMRPAYDRVQWALYRGDLKYIEYSDGEHELYDLSGDPQELDDLSSRRPEEVGRLRDALADWRGQVEPLVSAPSSPPAPDSETLERLRVLGYAE